MKDILIAVKEFYSWETETTKERVIEVISKFWITGLGLLAIVGWLVIVGATIMNPSMWDNVQFGIYDTLGY
jgi:hypothetical protein